MVIHKFSKIKMNVIYSCCVADPFLDVAVNLQKQYGLNPVYWVGDKSSSREGDDTESLVKKSFPSCVFHNYYDAWHGIFPTEIENAGADTYVDVDFLRKFSSEELQSFAMMNRLDFDRQSFNTMERERYFIRLVKYWTACLDKYKPVCVIGARTPHRVFDYVLYLLCQYRNIPVTSFQYAASFKRNLCMTGFSDPGKINSLIEDRYRYYLEKKDIDINGLPEDVRLNFVKTKSNYTVARPDYMKKHDVHDKQVHNPLFLIKQFVSSNHFFGEKSIFVNGAKRNIYKSSKHVIESTHFSVFEWYSERIAANKYKKRLLKMYQELAAPVDTTVPYVAFYLHYQPEVTTSPIGDIFVNQQLCIEMLLKYTPENYMVYVKEHPTQFMYHTLGHTCRIVDFYKDLSRYSRVRIVPLEMDSFELMQNAKAISTVTGTVGWEALLHRKPVIMFGQVWYEAMRNILRVTDEQSASKIKDFIETYQYDEHAILAYLYAISDVTIMAYHYDGFKKNSGIKKNECVENITQALSKLLETIINNNKQ